MGHRNRHRRRSRSREYRFPGELIEPPPPSILLDLQAECGIHARPEPSCFMCDLAVVLAEVPPSNRKGTAPFFGDAGDRPSTTWLAGRATVSDRENDARPGSEPEPGSDRPDSTGSDQ